MDVCMITFQISPVQHLLDRGDTVLVTCTYICIYIVIYIYTYALNYMLLFTSVSRAQQQVVPWSPRHSPINQLHAISPTKLSALPSSRQLLFSLFVRSYVTMHRVQKHNCTWHNISTTSNEMLQQFVIIHTNKHIAV